jgi:hypothetical protein
MSLLQVLIPAVIPGQKCLTNMSPILSGYGAMHTNSGWFERHKHDYRFTSSVTGAPLFIPCVMEYLNEKLPDGLVVVIRRTGHCGHRTSPSQGFCFMGSHKKHGVWTQSKQRRGTSWSNCRCCETWMTLMYVRFKFRHSQISVTVENQTYVFIWHFWLGMTSGIASWSVDIQPPNIIYISGSIAELFSYKLQLLLNWKIKMIFGCTWNILF